MPVGLFDTSTPLEPLRAPIRERRLELTNVALPITPVLRAAQVQAVVAAVAVSA